MWSQENLRQIVNWLEVSYPLEGCGLVLQSSDGTFRVHPCTNLADEYHAMDSQMYPGTGRDHYILNPIEIVRAEARGERIAVIFHSHPDVDDYFSEDDIAGALMPQGSEDEPPMPSYPGVDYLVVSVRNGCAKRATLFRFDEIQRLFVEAAVFNENKLQG